MEHKPNKLSYKELYAFIKAYSSWDDYLKILDYFTNKDLVVDDHGMLITEIGENKLKLISSKLKIESKDKKAERNKLHNETLLSNWKVKTFWPILIFGLFGGIYSGIDFIKSFTKSEVQQSEYLTKEELDSELNKFKVNIMKENIHDSIPKNELKSDSINN